MSVTLSDNSHDLSVALAAAEARNQELINALQQAQATARQATHRLEAIVGQLPMGLLLLEAGHSISEVSTAFLGFLGIESEAASWTGRPVAELMALADCELPAAAGRFVLERPGQRALECRRFEQPEGVILYCLHDITDEFRQQQHLLAVATVPEQAPYPMVRYGADRSVLYANPAALRLRDQLNVAEQEAIRAKLFAMAAEAFETNASRQLELNIGTRQYVAYVVPFQEEHHTNLYLLDITERYAAEARTRASEAAVREQQAFTQRILDSISSLVLVRNANNDLVFSNQAFRDVSAASPQGHEINQQAQQRLNEITHEVLRTGDEQVLEVPVMLQHDALHWLQVVKRYLLLPDGSANVLTVANDVTDLKQAQDTLRRSEKQYRDLMHYAHALIWTHDLNGNVLSANPALGRILGVDADYTIGRPLTDAIAPDRHPEVAQYLINIRECGEQTGVMKLRDMGGEVHYVLYHSRCVSEPGEEPYVVSYGQEITERVLAERATRQAKDEAEAMARARANFLANMSHEIRTPLNGVLGMASLLAKTALDPRQQHFLDVIRSSGRHLLGVINDVLDMAKISSGKLEMEQKPFNLCDAMSQAVEPLVLQAVQKGLRVKGTALRESCAYPWVLGDQQHLSQILINLTANAVKFTEPGGEVEIIGRQLAETADTLSVEFSVRDTGPGIPPDRIDSIFESFTQAYADTTRKHGGTGLGLTISRALVEQLGGTLSVESELGKGSTFAFRLTLPKADLVPKPREEDAPAAPKLRGKRVLLVEDNEINRDVARLLLEGQGMIVEEAEDGSVGVDRFYAHDYDVVLMDIQMPVLNGLQATARMRQHPDAAKAATPIIALTANAFREDNEQYLAAGMVACLAKPFDENNLFRTLEDVMSNQSAANEPAYDLTGLREMARGQDAFVLKIIRSFLANIPTSLMNLETAVALADWKEVARVVHHIKPNLAALRVSGVEAAVAKLEAVRHQPDDSPLAEAELQADAQRLIAAVQRALNELPRELPA